MTNLELLRKRGNTENTEIPLSTLRWFNFMGFNT